MPGRKMSKYMAKGGKFMAKKGGKFMAKKGGVKMKTMTVAQIRAAAKKKGYKLVKS